MICYNCKSSNKSKNGYSSRFSRWICKNCGVTYSENTGYPKTKIPFQFIALMLYRRRGFLEDLNNISKNKMKKGPNHFINYVNTYLPIINQKPVSRNTIYSWIRRYDKIFMDLISEQNALIWLNNNKISQPKTFPSGIPKFKIKKKYRKKDIKNILLIDKIGLLINYNTDFKRIS